ncbi:hypothetical protein [Acinetobacter proteolyticus]|uniref:Uncharacterized protein n=1 Tax=Acinetobacter proteolyticus TaxID=1776741 RepID=A0A2N0WFG7_9GAMM|nr:hypothetical protein [Acinetobacter proteolyticus]PKF33789.1 hypothetical protein CW311_08035 [Acinetobacter proteolyticus]
MSSSSKFILMVFGIIVVVVFFKSTFVYEDYVKKGERDFKYPYVVKIIDHGVDIYIAEEQNNIINTYYFISVFLIGSWLILFYVLKNKNRIEDKKDEDIE